MRFFGLGAGTATFIFLGSVMFLLSLLKTEIPVTAVRILNSAVGILLIFYGIKRLFKKNTSLVY